jgi:peptidoglycan/LPS O-acetylase OafA/YrhL
MLLGAPNVSTNIFEKSNLMITCGKYSFGFYLFHPMVMLLVKKYIKTKIHLEMIALDFIFSLTAGFLFHFLFEDRLIQFANRLCKRLASTDYFESVRTSKLEQIGTSGARFI